MAAWIKSIPEIEAGDATVAPSDPVSAEIRDEFWNTMMSVASDPFFEVTISDGQVAIAPSRNPVVKN